MTIQYKSATFNLTTNTQDNCINLSTDAVGIVKSVQASHEAASNVQVDAYLYKSKADIEISHDSLSAGFVNLVS